MSETKPKKSYRELRAELDEIMLALHGANVDIETATEQYERGIKLIKELEAHLKTTELKIEKISDNEE